jgi:hypothetical protein
MHALVTKFEYLSEIFLKEGAVYSDVLLGANKRGNVKNLTNVR